MTRLTGLSGLFLLVAVFTGCGPSLNIRRSACDAPHCELFVEDEAGSKNYVHVGSTQDNFSESRAHPQPVVTQNKDGSVDTYVPEPEYGNVFLLLPIELKDDTFSAVIAFDRSAGPGAPPYKVCQVITVDGSRHTDLWVPLRGVAEVPFEDVLGERAKARREAAARARQAELDAGPRMVPVGRR